MEKFPSWQGSFHINLMQMFIENLEKKNKSSWIVWWWLLSVLTYTSSHWLTYLTRRDSRSRRIKLSSLARRRILSARPACRIWKLVASSSSSTQQGWLPYRPTCSCFNLTFGQGKLFCRALHIVFLSNKIFLLINIHV